jgi:hypothetical protein
MDLAVALTPTLDTGAAALTADWMTSWTLGWNSLVSLVQPESGCRTPGSSSTGLDELRSSEPARSAASSAAIAPADIIHFVTRRGQQPLDFLLAETVTQEIAQLGPIAFRVVTQVAQKGLDSPTARLPTGQA